MHKIGFEYEGRIIGDTMWATVIDSKINANDLVHMIYSGKDRVEQNQKEFKDGYQALAELRLLPTPLSVSLDEFMQIFTSSINLFKNVIWKEGEVSERMHNWALEWLNKDLEEIAMMQRRSLRDKMGEGILINLKQVIAIRNGHFALFDNDADNRNRGGSLHINVSPVLPQDAVKFVTALHNELFSINKAFKFESGYRQELLFRYKDFDGTPGVEYMSIGFNYADLKPAEVRDIFLKIFTSVRKHVK